VAAGMIASQDQLTRADQAVGDGDHGVGMTRGFEAVQEKLQGKTFLSLGELFKTTGLALLTSIGGAAGAVFGTFFMGGGEQLNEKTDFNSEALAQLLNDGLQAVTTRGQARPGDKTMVDALAPAAEAAQVCASLPLDEALMAVAAAAKSGMEATKDMVARVGKAKTLGERSLGYPDPGAVSMWLIIDFMSQFTAGNDNVEVSNNASE
jgi:dihydroxyacetone kinase-like protein